MYKITFNISKEIHCIYGSIAAVINEAETGTKEEKSDFISAVFEAVNNASIFAYPNQENKPITVEIVVYKNSIEVTVTDKGCGIKDLEKAQEPLFSTEYDHAGLGFSIMKNSTDIFKVSSAVGSGTSVTLIKNFKEELYEL